MVAVGRTLPAPPELAGRWAAVFEEAGLRTQILELADRYPEERSLLVPFSVVEERDTPLADLLLERPDDVLRAGQQAMRALLPVAGPEADGLRLRVTGLPVTARKLIREIREADLNKFVAIDGIVRKATEVRPQIRDAVFSCLACRAEIHEPQEDGSMVFREPLECDPAQGGCGKPAGRTRFRLMAERSTYIDSQRIEVQENPETLRGGAHPQGMTVLLTEDLTGQILPGNRVIVNGTLKSLQRASASRSGVIRSVTFDLMVLGNSLEYKQREYDEIEITPEEEALISRFRGDPTIVDKVVLSLAPTIKGMEAEKEAIALQLFGGVEKRQPDGIRIRGDIHCLLVGDPGCLIGDERVTLADGTLTKLSRLGTAHFQPLATPVRVDGGRRATAARFHRYRHQPVMEVVTESGKAIQGTPNHPLLRWDQSRGRGEWCRLDRLAPGDRIVVADALPCTRRSRVPTRWRLSSSRRPNAGVRVPERWDPELALLAGYALGSGTRDAARLRLSVDGRDRDLARSLGTRLRQTFGVAPSSPRRRHRRLVVELRRGAVSDWFRGLRTRRVPDAILASPDAVVAAFLRGLFEARASVERATPSSGPYLRLVAPALEQLRDVQTLLLRWGIHAEVRIPSPPRSAPPAERTSRKVPRPSLLVQEARSLAEFARRIQFESRRKRCDLRQALRGRSSLSSTPRSLRTERVVSVRATGRATVYDIEVPGAHRFLANGVVSHNTAKSQLLRYVAEVAPRGIYTSGKGATAAGLTAAAVKDDFAGGRWVLEAGMLVLADGGMAVIDELDKMTPEDRSAMHEALEQQTVSVAKAGITATLNARCPVLAAANPKWGRFDSRKGVAEQIDLPPTLLSRFDVIYSITDRPDEDRDRLLAGRILESHREGEVRQSTGASGPTGAGAPFSSDFLRKYVAFARRTVRPVLSDEALQDLKDYYVSVRAQGKGADAPVPITARQLEALVRLAEACARARLSDVVNAEDAQRAIHVVQSFLERVATAEGKLDIDMIQTGVSHGQRERLELLQEIMRGLQAEKGAFSLEEVKDLAERQGIPPARSEALFHALRNQGDLMESRPGQWQLVRF